MAGSAAFPAADRTIIRSIWVFLAPGRFAAKTAVCEGWISLDFLGFSRKNRVFSMGYEAWSGEKFSRAFSLALRSAGAGACSRGHADALDCSWGKFTLASDFLQSIVVQAVPFRSPQKQLALASFLGPARGRAPEAPRLRTFRASDGALPTRRTIDSCQ